MVKRVLKSIWELIRDSYNGWSNDKAGRLGAALAYFTVFSLGPFLLIIIAMVSLIFGRAAAQGQIVTEAQGLIGRGGAEAIQSMLSNAYQSGSTIPATIFGLVMLMFGATGVFIQLRDALNTVWHVEEKPRGTIKGFLKARLSSFTMILGIGFLMLVSLVVSAGLSALSSFIGSLFPGLGVVLRLLDVLISLSVVTLLFALIFKFLPDADVKWQDVLVGATVTSALFAFGKYLIGLYLGNSSVGSTFGAASSLVIIMLWAYYSAQIMLFGAEFTKVYANRFGSKIYPDRDAVAMSTKKVAVEASRQ